jgi:hypothetical protein
VRACGFAHHTQRLAVVTRNAIASDTHVIEIFHQKVGGAGMAVITSGGCLHVIDRLRGGAHSCAIGVTSGAIFGSIFENTLNVTLFTFKGEVNVFQNEPGLGMVKRGRIRGGSRLSLACKANKQSKPPCSCYFDDDIVFY